MALTRDVLSPYLLVMRKELVASPSVEAFLVNSNGTPFTQAGLTAYYSTM